MDLETLVSYHNTTMRHNRVQLDSNLNKKGDSMDLWNVGILPQHYMASQPRRTWLETSPPWKPQHLIQIYFTGLNKTHIYVLKPSLRNSTLVSRKVRVTTHSYPWEKLNSISKFYQIWKIKLADRMARLLHALGPWNAYSRWSQFSQWIFRNSL